MYIEKTNYTKHRLEGGYCFFQTRSSKSFHYIPSEFWG